MWKSRVSPIRDAMEKKLYSLPSLGATFQSAKLPRSTWSQMEARYRGLLKAVPRRHVVIVNQAGEIVLLEPSGGKSSSDTGATKLLGQQVKNIIPEGFAERLLTREKRSRRRIHRTRKWEPELSFMGWA